jgi:hypothetical protein
MEDYDGSSECGLRLAKNMSAGTASEPPRSGAAAFPSRVERTNAPEADISTAGAIMARRIQRTAEFRSSFISNPDLEGLGESIVALCL